MKKVVLTISRAGGTGKSAFANLLLEHFREFAPEVKVIAVDGQPGIGSLSRRHGLKDADGAYCQALNRKALFDGVLEVDVRNGKNAMTWLFDITEAEPDLLLIDLPPDPMKELARLVGDIEVLKQSYTEYGYQVVVVLGVSPAASAAQDLPVLAESWGDGVEFLALLNLALAPRSGFLFYDGEYAADLGSPAESLKRQGGKELELLPLDPSLFALMNASNLPVWTLLKTRVGCLRGEQKRGVETWLSQMDALISRLGWIDYSDEARAAFEAALASLETERMAPSLSGDALGGKAESPARRPPARRSPARTKEKNEAATPALAPKSFMEIGTPESLLANRPLHALVKESLPELLALRELNVSWPAIAALVQSRAGRTWVGALRRLSSETSLAKKKARNEDPVGLSAAVAAAKLEIQRQAQKNKGEKNG